MSEVEDNIVAIGNLKGNHYLVEKYQRGYKWGIEQVHELLTDILDFEPSGIESFYCLQPVVVKSDPNTPKNFELIDGQQRLTTIYIILKCLKEDVYTLSYRTRESSEKFLKNIAALNLIPNLNVEHDIDDVILPQLQNAWNVYISKVPDEENNVDNYHFYCAYQYIHHWLETLGDQRAGFKDHLLNYTKVIEYEQSGSDSAEKVFINFNQGKIDLAQAELIKALFVLDLSKEKNSELRSFKLNQLAEEWNTIENQLQDDSFWFFVSNDVSDENRSNRIDLLFDLITEKPKSSNQKLYSYHHYLTKYNELKTVKNGSGLDWSAINELYNQLLEWYNDRELYHLVGFIVHANIRTTSDLNKEYGKVTSKLAFRKKLKEIIHEFLFKGDKKDRFNTASMTYGVRNDDIKTILVLHNVINYLFTDNYYRFPFDRLKKEKGWSLEHIHAQNTEKFEKIQDIELWIEDIKNLADDFEKDKELTEENVKELTKRSTAIRVKIQEEGISKDSKELKILVRALDEIATSYFKKDSLSNLCLLDRKTNSSIGNKFFSKKREVILQIDKMSLKEYNHRYDKNEETKPFIPLATKHVFLKYFTLQGDVRMTFWGARDRNDYQEHINAGITKFLKTEKTDEQ